jgi:hypothetical protein
VAQAGATQAVVVVEPTVMPASVDVEVAGEPTAVAELDEESSAGADEEDW